MVSKFYLFAPVVKEIIKTYVENGQSLIMEGCYIPFGREKDFADDYQCDIKYICLIFSEEYIRQHFADIVKNESVIETRLSTDITADDMIKSNGYNLEQYKFIVVLTIYIPTAPRRTTSSFLPVLPSQACIGICFSCNLSFY